MTGAAPAPSPRSGTRTDPGATVPDGREVCVYQALVTPEAVRRCAGLLDAAERERAGLLADRAAARFTVARGLLRSALSGRLGVPPGCVALAARCPACGEAGHGPVRLAGAGGAEWTVSIAHSGVLAAVALGRGAGPVGVDVETADRAAEIETLAPRLFGPEQSGRLTRLSASVRQAVLLRVWTSAESYAKATGTGLGHALARMDARVDTTGRVTVVGPEELAGWSVRTVPARAPGYAAAVTVRHGTRVHTHARTDLTAGTPIG
ncbi:4'-phosphopantetheinyl transferase family protein [Streptomyces sp. NPDC014735]|uniref:4'-phosphopantetheinyl transferase family protein n=1 Tax=unclassified Streptomyces TaxID=2593676 RepID=UPI0036F6AFAE